MIKVLLTLAIAAACQTANGMEERSLVPKKSAKEWNRYDQSNVTNRSKAREKRRVESSNKSVATDFSNITTRKKRTNKTAETPAPATESRTTATSTPKNVVICTPRKRPGTPVVKTGTDRRRKAANELPSRLATRFAYAINEGDMVEAVFLSYHLPHFGPVIIRDHMLKHPKRANQILNTHQLPQNIDQEQYCRFVKASFTVEIAKLEAKQALKEKK